MIISVEKFGKINKADITVGSFNIFVGCNNSGKTYLMQLIYGIIDYLTSRIQINENDIKRIFPSLPVNINSSNYNEIEEIINSALDKEKGRIIKYIFKKDISISNLSIKLDNFVNNYTVENIDITSLFKDFSAMEAEKKEFFSQFTNFQLKSDNRIITKFGLVIDRNRSLQSPLSQCLRLIISDYLGIKKTLRNMDNSLYLPASRSGLMLLYKHYFDKRNNNDFVISNEINNDNYNENEYGLTQPVFNFLSFLQKYEVSENNSKKHEKIISFINNHLIHGVLKSSGNTMLYSPNNSDVIIPAYLSSSMINEISPVMQLLTSINDYTYIYYDEIETCQHPLTQIQMARLLVRMVNAGYKMIVSTHSDTMASAINNLITLSLKKQNKSLLKKFEYEEDDILKSTDVKAYQFIIEENGKTRVEEIPSHFSIGIGFDFDIFNRANDKIYNDAVEIAEVD